MKKQEVRLFHKTNDKPIDVVINDFLKRYPNYSIERIAFDPQFDKSCDRVLVVFDIKDPPTTAVADGSWSHKMGGGRQNAR